MRIDSTDAINRAIDTKFHSDTKIHIRDARQTGTANERRFVPVTTEQVSDETGISEKAIRDAIDRVNIVIAGFNRQFDFSIHEKTHRIMVKVIDTETKEVIKEIPPEKILDMVAQMWEMAGILVDERR